MSDFRWNQGLSLILILIFISLPLGSIDKTDSIRIAQLIEKHKQDIIDIRRYIHMNPELSGNEFETSKLIASKLLSLDMEIKTGIVKTGVVSLLRGDQDGATIGVQADISAFPIEEQTGLPYESLNPGIMHASGNDIHTSIVLGTAIILSEMKDRVKGNIKFIFQPSEERKPPKEEGKAALMIKQGVLDNPPVRAVIGFHVWPEAETGKGLYSPNNIFAGLDTFEIFIKGKSSHGATPHKGIDAVYIASQVVVSVQSMINRLSNPLNPVAVNIGKISGGTHPHIIAEEAKLEGTVRSLSSETQKTITELLEKTVSSIAQPFGASYSYTYKKGIPPLYNHPDLGFILAPSLVKSLGENHVHPFSPQMAAEDFSEYTEKIPGFYFLLGVRPPWENSISSLYSSNFTPDEDCIPIGIKTLCYLLIDCLDYQEQFENHHP
jgi:amidohydrolase